MSIEALTGKVGSGKTLKMVTDSLNHFERGGCVCSNVELDRDAIARELWRRRRRFFDSQYVELPMRQDPCFHRYMRRAAPGSNLKVMVYIDEAHLFFPASEYRALQKQFLSVESFVSQSRRVGCDIIFITQAWSNVWGQLQKQALFITECRDFRVLKLPLIGDSLGNFLGLKWAKKDAATGVVLEDGATKLSKGVFECYSTSQAYNDEMSEIMQTMEIFKEQTERVGLLERFLRKPPPAVIPPPPEIIL